MLIISNIKLYFIRIIILSNGNFIIVLLFTYVNYIGTDM